MDSRTNRLLITQIDKKLAPYYNIPKDSRPDIGWVETVRKTIGLNMAQLARRMGKSLQAIKQMQDREKDGTITLNSLKSIAEAMDMRLVYAIIPKETSSLEEYIQRKAEAIAKDIVYRTNKTMYLEDQQINHEKIRQSVEELSKELIQTPKKLWD